jgi:hypothetical protein
MQKKKDKSSKANKNIQLQNVGSAIRINHFPDIELKYAHQTRISYSENDIILSFLQLLPPVLFEKTDISELSEHIEVKCISRIAINPDYIPNLIEQLTSVFNNYLEIFGNDIIEDGETSLKIIDE